MKINCTCNHTITDNTDYLVYKGHMVSDTQWFKFWNAIDDAIENSGNSVKEKEEACMELRRKKIFSTLWECQSCGKLFIDGNDDNLYQYTPDSNKYNQILNMKTSLV